MVVIFRGHGRSVEPPVVEKELTQPQWSNDEDIAFGWLTISEDGLVGKYQTGGILEANLKGFRWAFGLSFTKKLGGYKC